MPANVITINHKIEYIVPDSFMPELIKHLEAIKEKTNNQPKAQTISGAGGIEPKEEFGKIE